MTTRTFTLSSSGLPAEGCQFDAPAGPCAVRCTSGAPSVTVFERMGSVTASADSGSLVFDEHATDEMLDRTVVRMSEAIGHLHNVLAELVAHGFAAPVPAWPAASAADAWLAGLVA